MAKRARRKRMKDRKRNEPAPVPPSFLENYGKPIAAVIVVFLLVVVAAYAVTNMPADEGNGGNGNTPPTRTVAPTFELMDIDGNPAHLAQYRGRVVVLDLFATWCPPCQEQMEDLNDVRAHYPETEVIILSIDIDPDNPTENENSVRDFKAQHKANWQFAMDNGEVNEGYGTGSIPTLAIIDQEGYLVWTHEGAIDSQTIIEQIDPLL